VPAPARMHSLRWGKVGGSGHQKPFYVRELGWSFLQYSQTGGAAALMILAASVLRGWSADRFDKPVMALGFGLYGCLAMACGLSSCFGHHPLPCFAFLLIEPAATTFGSIAFFALAMRVSHGEAAVTVFSTLLASATIGHVASDLLTGRLTDAQHWSYWRYGSLLFLGGSLMTASLVLLPCLTLEDRAKNYANPSSAVSFEVP
jgi:MFS family permease